MKSILATFWVLLLLVAVSCNNNEPPDNPAWINNWIIEIESDEYCHICEIHRYEFNGDFFYELYSPILSCMPCQVHDAEGFDVDWTDFTPEEYLNKRKNKSIVYKKPTN